MPTIVSVTDNTLNERQMLVPIKLIGGDKMPQRILKHSIHVLSPTICLRVICCAHAASDLQKLAVLSPESVLLFCDPTMPASILAKHSAV